MVVNSAFNYTFGKVGVYYQMNLKTYQKIYKGKLYPIIHSTFATDTLDDMLFLFVCKQLIMLKRDLKYYSSILRRIFGL